MIDRKEWVRTERQYHDKTAKQYVEKYGKARQHQVPEEIFLFRYLPRNASSRILIIDIGCGPSIFISKKLKEFKTPFQYIGVDISEELIKIAKKNLPEAIFIIADGSQMPFKESVADFVISLGGLHHIPDVKDTIIYLIKILRPGGYLFLREPSPEAFRDSWRGESPMERGIDPRKAISIIKSQNAMLVDYRHFNSKFFYSIQHLLHITRLYRLLEWSDKYWKIKTHIDSATSRTLGSVYQFFKGLDFCLVARKK